MGFNKIFVLGAGAIGSALGALLSDKNDVTLISNKDHVKAIISKGLTISGDVERIFHIKASTKIRKIPEKTLIILTTKAYDSSKAIKGIKDILGKDTTILILQNGLGNEEAIKQVLNDKNVIVRGITAIAAEFLEPGEIKLWSGQVIVGRTAFSDEISGMFNECGLKTYVSNNIENEIWGKLVINCVVNPLTALFRVRNYAIFDDALKVVRHQIVSECITVGNAEGVTLPTDLEPNIEREASKYTNYSSMCQDVMKRKETEIDFLNGKIVELGRKHKVATPVNETVTCLIKFLSEKYEFPRRD